MTALAFVAFVWIAFLVGCAVMVALDNRAARKVRDRALLAHLDHPDVFRDFDQAIAFTLPVIDAAELAALTTTADLPKEFRTC